MLPPPSPPAPTPSPLRAWQAASRCTRRPLGAVLLSLSWEVPDRGAAPPCHPLQAVREQIRRLAVGGPQSKEEQANVYEVAESDEEDLGVEGSAGWAAGSSARAPAPGWLRAAAGWSTAAAGLLILRRPLGPRPPAPRSSSVTSAASLRQHQQPPKSAAVLDFICQSLRNSFVFTGIKDELLREVRLARSRAGAGARPRAGARAGAAAGG